MASRFFQDWRAEEWNLTPDDTKNNAAELERNRSPYLSFPCEETGNTGEPPLYDVIYTHFKGKTIDYDHDRGLEACLVWFVDESGFINNPEDVQWEVALHAVTDDCSDSIDTDHTFVFNTEVDTPCLDASGNAIPGVRHYTTVDLPIDDGLVRDQFFEIEVRRICGDTNTGNTGELYDVGLQFVQLREKDR